MRQVYLKTGPTVEVRNLQPSITADEAEVPVPTLKHVHDRLRGRRQRPLGPYDAGADDQVYLVTVLDESFPDFIAHS